MESWLVPHEGGGVEKSGRMEEGKTRAPRTTCPLLLRLFAPLIAVLFLDAPREVASSRGAGIESLFCPGHRIRERLLHPCFAPGSLRYDVVKFYRSQNFLTSLFLNINETISPVVLFRQLTLISFTPKRDVVFTPILR